MTDSHHLSPHHRPLTLVLLVLAGIALSARDLRARMTLLTDEGFETYTRAAPGPWEFRHGHKGGDYPKARPTWQVRSEPRQDGGRCLGIRKNRSAAGIVLIGQRLALPDPLSQLDFSVRYQSYCAGENRSGIVTLHLFTPELWDDLPRTPETAFERSPEADILQVVIHPQGEDVTTWTWGRVPTDVLQKAIQGRAGQTVVAAVSFMAWHETTDEWARLDDLHLGDPLPHVEPVNWPRYVFRGEPVALTVSAFSRVPGAHPQLEWRHPGGERPWEGVAMARAGSLWRGTVPAETAAHPFTVRAKLDAGKGSTLITEERPMTLTERPQHPNLFYSTTELARMREKAATFDWARRVRDGVVARAESWMTRAFEPQVISGAWWHNYNCKTCGVRLRMDGPREHYCRTCDKVWDTEILYGVYWSKVHGDHAAAAQDLALAYQMTGKEAYARRAIEFLLWYADHYAEFPTADKGGKVVSQTLDESVWLLKIMGAADLAYPAMTEDEAHHIEQDLIRAGAQYIRKYRGGIHNIRCWHNSAWAAAGYFLGDPELVAFARDHRYGFVAQMEQGVLEDGMWYERSMGYHHYTVSAILYHLKAAMHNGDDLHLMPQVRKLLTFPLMITFPNLVTPSLNDGGYSTRRIGPQRLELAAAWYNDASALSALQMLYNQGASRSSYQAWQFGEVLPAAKTYTPPPSRDLAGAGLAVLRKGAGDNAVCAMLEYGEHGGGHGHPDKLQLILYGLGRQLCPDPGTVGYANPLHGRYYKTTPAHNTVTVGGRNMAGVAGELLAFEDRGDHAVAVAASGKLYPDRRLVRRILLTERFLVDDLVVTGNRTEPLDWFLRCEGTLALTVTTQPGDETPLSAPYAYMREPAHADHAGDWTATWTLSDDGGDSPRLVVTMQAAPDTRITAAKAPGPAGQGTQWDTLRVRRTAPATRFRAVHQFCPRGTRPRTVTFSTDTVTIGSTTVGLPDDTGRAPVIRER